MPAEDLVSCPRYAALAKQSIAATAEKEVKRQCPRGAHGHGSV